MNSKSWFSMVRSRLYLRETETSPCKFSESVNVWQGTSRMPPIRGLFIKKWDFCYNRQKWVLSTFISFTFLNTLNIKSLIKVFFHPVLECASVIQKRYSPLTLKTRYLNLERNESENSVKIAVCSFKLIGKCHVMIYLMNMKDNPMVVFNFQANSHVCTLQCGQEHFYVKVWPFSFLTLVYWSCNIFVH